MKIVSKSPHDCKEKHSHNFCGESTSVHTGKPGPPGAAATIEIKEVITVEPSDSARVENVGDENNAKLVFYIPKGDPGNPAKPGQGGAEETPYFDLASMGLPALPVEGGTVECFTDTSELRTALSKGTVKLRGQVQNLDGDFFYGTAVANPTFAEDSEIYELSVTFAIDYDFVTAVVWVYEDGLLCDVRRHGSGASEFETDETLKFENGVLSVNTTSTMEENNTLPITSAAVYTVVGNINAILDTI